MTPSWLKFLPAALRAKVEHRPNLQSALTNAGWLFGDKILRMGVGLFVGVWVARYLGPEQFGLLSYAMAIVALFGSVASLGLNEIVMRDLVKEPEKANETLGTAFILQAIGGLLAFGLAVFTVSLARPNDNLAKLVVAVLGFVMVLKSTEVVKYWCESQVKSKYVIWLENGIFLVLAGVKIGLILMEVSLLGFVWVAFAEGVLVAAGMLGVYSWRGGPLFAWRTRYTRAKALLKDSWPLILSGLAIMVYIRIDQVMLGQMLGDDAVGIYSAAVRISEIWYFIPMAIVSSVFPAILRTKEMSEKLYLQRVQTLYTFLTMISVCVAVLFTALSEYVVLFLYGHSYSHAAPILTIQIWAGVFVSMGVARGKWLLIENLQNLGYWYVGFAMVVNIVGNFLLIPAYGAIGAAVATVISQVVAAIIAPAFFLKTRMSAVMLLQSLNPLAWLTLISLVRKSKP